MFTKAILIPGGGLEQDGTVHPWVKRSLDKAISLFTGKELLIPLSRGTIYKPPILDAKGFPIYESVAAGNYLLSKGIPKENIRVETQSLDTIGNAYFSRIVFIDPMQISAITVITSAFHMERVQFIFKWMYGLTPQQAHQLDFLTISEEGFDTTALAARRKKEQQRLAQTKTIATRFNNLQSFHQWLFTEHKAYAFGSFANDTLDPLTLKTY